MPLSGGGPPLSLIAASVAKALSALNATVASAREKILMSAIFHYYYSVSCRIISFQVMDPT